jgi:hypothetical protein
MLPAHIAIIVDDDKDVNLVLSATLKLKKFDVHKTYSAEECLVEWFYLLFYNLFFNNIISVGIQRIYRHRTELFYQVINLLPICSSNA